MGPRTARPALVVSLTFVAASAPAREPDPSPVKARVQEFVTALSGRDAATVAAFWTPTGEYTQGVVTIRGRDNIRKAYAEHIRKKPAGTITVTDDTVRFLSDAVAGPPSSTAVPPPPAPDRSAGVPARPGACG